MVRTGLVSTILAVGGVGQAAGCCGPDAPQKGNSTET